MNFTYKQTEKDMETQPQSELQELRKQLNALIERFEDAQKLAEIRAYLVEGILTESAPKTLTPASDRRSKPLYIPQIGA